MKSATQLQQARARCSARSPAEERRGYGRDRSAPPQTSARLRGLLAVACAALSLLRTAWAAETASVPHGRLETINGCTVVTVDGSPEEMGTAYGRLLGPVAARVIRDMITEGIGRDPSAYANMIAASRRMERFQPPEYIAELKALACAAQVSYDDLLLLQYFGDVRRCIDGAGGSFMCTSFAALPPLTRGETCIVGRNLDYFDHGVGEYASILACYRPTGRIPFVTVTWAGIINGWTLLNAQGIVVSNNTAFGARSQSLEGVSTCFLLRYVAERARSVAEGVRMVQEAQRACGTSMLIASGSPPDAAVVEFDHAETAVRRPSEGFVGAANDFLALYADGATEAFLIGGRVDVARGLASSLRGRVDLETNLAGAQGVPIRSMNLHSAMIDATNLRLRVAMGRIPACDLPYRALRFTGEGLAADGPEAAAPADGAAGPARGRSFAFSDVFALFMGALMVAVFFYLTWKLAVTAITGKRPVRALDRSERGDKP